MFFPDVSAELLKKRKIFDQVKKDLSSISLELPELRYGVVHPATLLVTYKKKRHAFDKAAEAESFVLQLQRERNLVTNQVEATILDPRYRGSMEEAGSLDDVKHQLVQELLDLKGPEVREEGASGEGSSQAAGGNKHESTADPPTKKKRLSDLLQNRRAELTVQTQATYPKREQADAELTKFLQEDAIDASCDPLMWWCDNQRRYPLMANLAKKYMCICATSTSSERMFSTAGNIATPERSCLKPHKLNMLVFLKNNSYPSSHPSLETGTLVQVEQTQVLNSGLLRG
uniref:HAT C-terminal dimerisation domain-containing protein n=1 Tax=Xiphophorus maculatus TaxID=8083 RepID=M3ZUA0_XIPMA